MADYSQDILKKILQSKAEKDSSLFSPASPSDFPTEANPFAVERSPAAEVLKEADDTHQVFPKTFGELLQEYKKENKGQNPLSVRELMDFKKKKYILPYDQEANKQMMTDVIGKRKEIEDYKKEHPEASYLDSKERDVDSLYLNKWDVEHPRPMLDINLDNINQPYDKKAQEKYNQELKQWEKERAEFAKTIPHLGLYSDEARAKYEADLKKQSQVPSYADLQKADREAIDKEESEEKAPGSVTGSDFNYINRQLGEEKAPVPEALKEGGYKLPDIADAFRRAEENRRGAGIRQASGELATALLNLGNTVGKGIENPFTSNATFAKEADRPIQDLKEQLAIFKEELEAKTAGDRSDPNSPVSKHYRDLAKSVGINVIGTESAADLEKINDITLKKVIEQERNKAEMAKAQLQIDMKREMLMEKMNQKDKENFKRYQAASDPNAMKTSTSEGREAVKFNTGLHVLNALEGLDPKNVDPWRKTELAIGLAGMMSQGAPHASTIAHLNTLSWPELLSKAYYTATGKVASANSAELVKQFETQITGQMAVSAQKMREFTNQKLGVAHRQLSPDSYQLLWEEAQLRDYMNWKPTHGFEKYMSGKNVGKLYTPPVPDMLKQSPTEQDQSAQKALKPSGESVPMNEDSAYNKDTIGLSFPSLPNSEQFKPVIEKAANKVGVDANILFAMARRESAFRPEVISGDVKSSTGATGLFQFMPGTAADYGVDPTNPTSSAIGAARYMRKLLKMWDGDYVKAVASYNWGEGNVQNLLQKHPDDWMKRLPDETKNYVAQIFGDVDRLRKQNVEKVASQQYNQLISRSEVSKYASDNGISEEETEKLLKQAGYGII